MTATAACYPLDPLTDPRLTSTAARLLAILPKLATSTTGEVTASHSQLAELLESSRRTITNAVKLLRTIGLLDCIPGSGRRVTRYRLPAALLAIVRANHNTAPPAADTPAHTHTHTHTPARDVVKNRVVVVNKKTNNQQQTPQDSAPAPAHESESDTRHSANLHRAPAKAAKLSDQESHKAPQETDTPAPQRYAVELRGLPPEVAKTLLTELDAARKIRQIKSPRGYLLALVKSYHAGTFTPTATEQQQAQQQQQQQQQASEAEQQQSEAERRAADDAAYWRSNAGYVLRELIDDCAKTGESLPDAVARTKAEQPRIADYLQQHYDDYCRRQAERPPIPDAAKRRRMIEALHKTK